MWRRPERGDTLPDIECHYGGLIFGHERCWATGLERGDCSQKRVDGSRYCYYHEKIQAGLAEPNTHQYPVWPLPKTGYVLVGEANPVAMMTAGA